MATSVEGVGGTSDPVAYQNQSPREITEFDATGGSDEAGRAAAVDEVTGAIVQTALMMMFPEARRVLERAESFNKEIVEDT